jgi:hypothetical protein
LYQARLKAIWEELLFPSYYARFGHKDTSTFGGELQIGIADEANAGGFDGSQDARADEHLSDAVPVGSDVLIAGMSDGASLVIVVGGMRDEEPKVATCLILGNECQQRFFLFVNYMDAHWPFLPPPPFDTRYPGKDGAFPWPVGKKTPLKFFSWRVSKSVQDDGG